MTAMEQTANHNTDTTQLVNKRVNRLLIFLILLSTGIFTYLRSHYREPIQDDIVYGYVLETDHWHGYWEKGGLKRKLSSPSQIVDSQINLYKYGNGRSIVHAVQQLFVGFIGPDVYCVFGALMMIVLTTASVYIAIPASSRFNPAWWLLTVIALMYLFPYPHRLWYSVNMSCNYLIPSVLMAIELLSFRYVNTYRIGAGALIGVGILSFVFGWSHEAFALPVAGAVFFYYILHWRQFCRQGWVLALPLFAGALAILASPGNWSRAAEQATSSLSENIVFATHWLLTIPIIRVAIVVFIMNMIWGKVSWRDYVSRNSVLLMAGILALGFLLSIGAWTYAFTPVCLIILWLMLSLLAAKSFFLHRKLYRVCVASMIGLFVVHQSSISLYARQLAPYHRDIIKQFVASEDGAVCNNAPKVPEIMRPYITTFPMWEKPNLESFGSLELTAGVLSDFNKDFVFLDPLTFEAVTAEKFPAPDDSAISPFVKLDTEYVCPEDSVAAGTEFEMEYHPVDFSHDTAPLWLRIKFALVSPDYYPNSERVTPDTAVIGNRRFLYIPVPEIRRVKAIRGIKEPA